MRILYVAAFAALLPMGAFAQTEPATPPAPSPGIGSVSPTLVVAGVVGAAVVADIVSGGALSGPVMRLIGRQAAPAAAAATRTTAAPAATAAAARVAAPAAPAAAAVRPWWRFW